MSVALYLSTSLINPTLCQTEGFVGAMPHGRPPKGSPLTPEEELATFSVPPGFKVELVAAEPDGGKFVTVAFDHAGRMWTMTAFEYPLDANEAAAEARALFAQGGRDRVLVFDTPTLPVRQKPRIFADGLAIPLGLLPYKNGAFVQYDGEIRFYEDTNGDGRADKFTPVLTGFGIEDSHLFPHQFTRAPGGWILIAQGAFNYSKVKTELGGVTEFNKTKLARFTPDGKRFDIIGWGPCNVWGLVVDRLGEIFIQEANDQGWPMMPFLEGASYPLCGDDVPRPYAPPFPKTGEKEMGGTGLSGLAFSEGGDSFPGAYHDVFYIANPITGKIQAIRCHRGVDQPEAQNPKLEPFGNGWRLEHLPDFVQCGDPWFRPVSIHFGPDGCLYIVDWYNKIISHNEVPRNHPERDKTRGRIWRVRHESQPPRTNLPNLYKASDAELLVHLHAANTWEVNAAWQEIVDRRAVSLAPKLAKLLMVDSQPSDLRVRALWCLEGLGRIETKQLEKLVTAPHRALRKEALRVAHGGAGQVSRLKFDSALTLAKRGVADSDRLVREEAIRLLDALLDDPRTEAGRGRGTVIVLLDVATHPPATGGPRFQPYFGAFETYLVRRALERRPDVLTSWLDTDVSAPLEARALGCVTLGGVKGAKRLAALLPQLRRGLSTEELLLIASVPADPAAKTALQAALAVPGTLRLLYDNRNRLPDHGALAPLLTDAIRAFVKNDPGDANQDLLVKLAAGFHLGGLENELVSAATKPGANAERQLAALRALRESGSSRVDVFRRFATSANPAVQREAVTALSGTKSDLAVPALLEVWPSLTPTLRKTAVDRLANSAAGAKQLVAAVGSGAIIRDELDGYTLDKISIVLPDDPAVKKLVAELGSELRPVLRLNGGDGDYVDTDLSLRGPFTVECWVRLDPGINNQDSILAGPGALDANFHDSRFRVWVGGSINDIVVATKPVAPEAWTHLAFTRDADGRFRIFLNGELEVTSQAVEKRNFEHLRAGHSNVSGGTAGEFAEFRVWSVCRSPDEIRASANVSLGRETGAASALLYHGSGGSWGTLHGNARIERTADFPPLQTEAEAKTLESKFDRFRLFANQRGDLARGQQLFVSTCGVCHTVKGLGGKIGPVLDGAGANGVEALLRNILTPNAAMEAGYRRFRVETRDGEVQEGLLVSQDDNSVVLRQPNTEDLRLSRGNIKRAGFMKLSIMPEGLLEGLKAEDVIDLFAYLKTLK
jgi:putative heme-binding domain-containing protein